VLATVKDVISREATQTKIKLDIKTPAIDEKAVVEVCAHSDVRKFVIQWESESG